MHRHMHRRRDGCSRVEVEAVSGLGCLWLGGQLRRTESERCLSSWSRSSRPITKPHNDDAGGADAGGSVVNDKEGSGHGERRTGAV